MPRVIGGRYGLSSKEFTPAMVRAVFDELAPTRRGAGSPSASTTTSRGTSLTVDATLDIEDPRQLRAVFYGLGADGTVGANKNSIKIIGADTRVFAQAYFVYDSKKSGAQTVSHLRFGARSPSTPYL
jgi:pyruvate-ferredoxin/flavodoxin oxidoreductase